MQAAKELKIKDRADVMYDLIGVACAPHGNQKHVDDLRHMWRTIREDAIPELKRERVTYDDAGTPFIPWRQASELMMSQMNVMRKVKCGG